MIAELEGTEDYPQVVVFVEKGRVARILTEKGITVEVVDYDDKDTDPALADKYGDRLKAAGYVYSDE
jgi:hypothetical protein